MASDCVSNARAGATAGRVARTIVVISRTEAQGARVAMARWRKVTHTNTRAQTTTQHTHTHTHHTRNTHTAPHVLLPVLAGLDGTLIPACLRHEEALALGRERAAAVPAVLRSDGVRMAARKNERKKEGDIARAQQDMWRRQRACVSSASCSVCESWRRIIAHARARARAAGTVRTRRAPRHWWLTRGWPSRSCSTSPRRRRCTPSPSDQARALRHPCAGTGCGTRRTCPPRAPRRRRPRQAPTSSRAAPSSVREKKRALK